MKYPGFVQHKQYSGGLAHKYYCAAFDLSVKDLGRDRHIELKVYSWSWLNLCKNYKICFRVDDMLFMHVTYREHP